jgi:hypothetical protein
MTNYWLIVHNERSYEEHPDKIGLGKGKAKGDKNFKSIRNEDRIIYYAKNKQSLGLFRVVSKGYLSTRGLWGGKPGEHYVYDIEPICVAPTKNLVELDTKDYGIKSLHGRTAVKLTRDQYKSMKSKILGMDDPASEAGVFCLFSKIHRFLGFQFIKEIKDRFPDCIALDNEGKEVRIEFEESSSKFDHNEKECDFIICWRDDSGGFTQLQVIELRELIYGH